MTAPPPQTILIAGAGIPGLVLALALKRGLGAAIDVRVADPAWGRDRDSGRATAVAAGPRRMLETLGVWQAIAAVAQPIRAMHITDSRLADAIRPVYLRFDGAIAEGEPFAHMVEDDALVAALGAACDEAGVVFAAEKVELLAPAPGTLRAQLGSGAEVAAKLVVAADGARSRLRAQMKIACVGRAYPQAAIVATIAHERDHEGRADEHFLPGGPFALLPLTGRRCSIVWTEMRGEARRLVALAPDAFIEALETRAGYHLGALRLEGRARLFPLALNLARSYIAPRFALLGDAAHSIHPLAGQGLNLGLRDAAALAEGICDQVRLGLDIGEDAMLETYQRARRFDALAMAAATDVLNTLFKPDLLPLRMLRDLGLGLVERMPALKALLMREAAAVSGAGRLFRGEWV